MRYEEPIFLVIHLENRDIVTISGLEGGDGNYTPGGGLLPQATGEDAF